MSGLLSVISGGFAKTLVLATYLPTLAFSILALAVMGPLLAEDWTPIFPLTLESLDPQWRLLVFTLFTFVLSGMLYYLNAPIVRLYEGYPWQATWIGRLSSARQLARYNRLEVRLRGMRTLLRKLRRDAPASNDPRVARVDAEWSRVTLELSTDFPGSGLILPTRLGNVIRAFEYYPDRQYAMDAVTLWSRLVSKVDPAYASAMDDAKAAFDFMLNCSVLSIALALLLIAFGFLHQEQLSSTSAANTWFFQVVALLGLAYGFYGWAISRARDWGRFVKGAFDLYRAPLLDSLGFKTPPTSLVEERKLWFGISRQLLYGDSPSGGSPDLLAPTVDYAYVMQPKPAAAARGGRAVPDLQTMRSQGSINPDGVATVKVEVYNQSNYSGLDVLVTDSVLDGFQYQAGSAIVEHDHVIVTGGNPYYFAIGRVPAQGVQTLTYVIVRIPKQS